MHHGLQRFQRHPALTFTVNRCLLSGHLRASWPVLEFCLTACPNQDHLNRGLRAASRYSSIATPFRIRHSQPETDRMKATPQHWTVEHILNLRRNKLLEVDPEYQRGHVWTRIQQQYFIDSILRGYHIPLFYLHVQKGKMVGSHQVGDRLYIVDGQQRLQALWAFSEGAFKLLDPREHVGRFPLAMAAKTCEWAGRDIHRLDEGTKTRFSETKLSVVEIETDDHTEVRDLFIRLQGGKPLTPQEQRDAWPGEFGAYVCRIGGKAGIDKYPGHDVFLRLMRSPTNAKNPKARQLAAQMIMLFDKNRRDGEFCDIRRRSVDAYYIKNLGFDAESSLAREFSSVLDTVARLLGDGKRSTLVGHQAMHVVLLTRVLSDGTYVRESWEPKFAAAFDHFTKQLAESRAKERNEKVADQYMRNYGYKTQTGSDTAGTIRDRQMFFQCQDAGAHAAHEQGRSPNLRDD